MENDIISVFEEIAPVNSYVICNKGAFQCKWKNAQEEVPNNCLCVFENVLDECKKEFIFSKANLWNPKTKFLKIKNSNLIYEALKLIIF